MPHKLIVLSSGFPKTVRAKGYYETEETGCFPLSEALIQAGIEAHQDFERFQSLYIYGDYGAVNPEPSYGFSPSTYWPRIELPWAGSLYYYRTKPVLIDGDTKTKHDRATAFECSPRLLCR